MTLPVVFRRAAAEEFLEARDWYEAKREGLGQDFAVVLAVFHCARDPSIWRDR